MIKEKATHAHLACMNTIVDKNASSQKKHDYFRKNILDKAYSLLIEKAWIAKTLSSLYKDGEHNVIGVKYLEIGYISKNTN